MIEVHDLAYAFEDGARALNGISFTVEPGERIVLLGVNGSGKSTLLKILNGLVFPDRGRYAFQGTKINKSALAKADVRGAFRKRTALLFQQPDAMIFNPTVRDEIAFGPRQAGLDRIAERVDQWARTFGLERLLERTPFHLSGGEKQKLCLAALLIMEPDLLLLDEPTANLDPRTTGWLIDLLQDLALTTIVATHNLSLASELGARALVLSEDHALIFDGELASLLADPDRLLAANLVHSHRHHHGSLEHRHYHIHDWD